MIPNDHRKLTGAWDYRTKHCTKFYNYKDETYIHVSIIRKTLQNLKDPANEQHLRHKNIHTACRNTTELLELECLIVDLKIKLQRSVA